MADASDGLSPDLAGSVTANYNDPHSDSNRVGILDLILVIPSVGSARKLPQKRENLMVQVEFGEMINIERTE